MTPGRRRDLVVAAMLAAKKPMEVTLRRVKVPERDLEDIVHDAFVVLLAALDAGRFTLPEDERAWRGVIGAYLATAAWRRGRDHARRLARESLRAKLPEEIVDMTARVDARSQVRALDIPDDVLPLLVEIAEGSDVATAARAVGLKTPTAYDKLRRFRLRVAKGQRP